MRYLDEMKLGFFKKFKLLQVISEVFNFISCFIWIVSIIIVVIKLHDGIIVCLLKCVRLNWLPRESSARVRVQHDVIGVMRCVLRIGNLAILHVILWLLFIRLTNVSSLRLLDVTLESHDTLLKNCESKIHINDRNQ